MKRLKSLLIAGVILFGTMQTINAQAKTAHVDVNEIISKKKFVFDFLCVTLLKIFIL